MKRLFAFGLLALTLPASAQEEFVTPAGIVDKAPASDWVPIDPADLLVMDLAQDRDDNPRRVVIQLMPAPFSQGWVGNIRKLAAAHWWDGTSVNRVQDNYVVQWGDVTEKKALPDGLQVVPESEYTAKLPISLTHRRDASMHRIVRHDAYAPYAFINGGWPVAMALPPIMARPAPKEGAPIKPFPEALSDAWPTHCYGMVGVGRDVSPDTGTGAELYTVIGHAPRQLDRNIALVGRIIDGMENLSSLPRGHGELGFYAEDEADKRVPILSTRLGTEITDLPRFEYLSTESGSFAAYAHARANRKDDFYIQPAGGVDVCNVPVPIRRVKTPG